MEILDDLPRILFLLSFVLIGLFRWIANTIAERRNNPADGDSGQSGSPDESWTPPASTPPPPQQPPPALPEAMREFFETIARPETTPPPVPAAPTQTPTRSQNRQSALSKAERDALATIKQATGKTYPRGSRKRPKKPSFANLFADPAALKRAFVMKEILDEPKALKSPGTLGSF